MTSESKSFVQTDSCNGYYIYHCATDRKCIYGDEWIRCNYHKDCPSGEDEEGCRKMKEFKINLRKL